MPRFVSAKKTKKLARISSWSSVQSLEPHRAPTWPNSLGSEHMTRTGSETFLFILDNPMIESLPPAGHGSQ